LIFARKIADTFKPDLTMAYFTIPCGIISLWLKWRRRIPYITLLRGQDVPGWLPEMLKNFHAVCKPIIRLVWRKSERVAANSRELAELAKRTVPNMDILSIPNGIDAGLYCPSSDQKQPDRVEVFFAGRLRYQKGLDCLIGSIGRLKKDGYEKAGRFPEFRLRIAGCGPLEDFLKKLVREKGIEKEVVFLGHLDENELIDAYQHSDVFVNPSRYEGMPNALLEAMACGLPCVVTKVEGHDELVKEGENGFLVPKESESTLADAIGRLIVNETLRKKMGRRSREIAIENFTWKATAHEFLKIMRKPSALP
jgi:glycosyltransferase involved in cell wall biosynthesis